MSDFLEWREKTLYKKKTKNEEGKMKIEDSWIFVMSTFLNKGKIDTKKKNVVFLK